MKITAKTTKEQLVKALGVNSKAVKEADKNLYDRLVYTSNAMKKDVKSVTKSDLVELVRDTIKSLGDKFVEPALAEEKTETKETKTEKTTSKKESSLKSKVSKKSAEKSEVVSEQSAEETKEEAVKSAKKTGAEKPVKKSAEKKSGVSEKAIQLAGVFNDTLEIEGETYKIAHDIKDMKTLHDAVEKDETIVFAIYWTARHLRQFNYFNGWVKKPKSFPNDLDLATCLFVSDEGAITYALSMYTEGLYTFLPIDLVEDEDHIRYCDGMEYQIYRKVESK